jgi:hypothetical protein
MKRARGLVFAVLPIAAIAQLAVLSGCFALFTLDEYGVTAAPSTDAAPSDAEVDDAPKVTDASADAPLPTGKIVFVTNAEYQVDENRQPNPNNISGVKTANDHCTKAAAAAGLQGKFLAWISDTSSSPSTTFASLSADAQAPAAPPTTQLITPTHQIIAASYAELAQTGPRVAIVVTETSVSLPEAPPKEAGSGGNCPGEGALVWTATDERGASLEKVDNCGNWQSNAAAATSRVGRLVKNRVDWTNACATPCNIKAHLYCFEQ